MLTKSSLNILHNLEHTLLVLLREVLGNIHFANSLTEDSVRHAHSTLPARLLLLSAGHLAGEKIERSIVKIIADGATGIRKQLSLKVMSEHCRVSLSDEGINGAEE